MLDYFKKNPTALMDAIPTPRGESEDEEDLKDFRSGLSPMRKNQFKFNPGSKMRTSGTNFMNRRTPSRSPAKI